MTLFADLHLHSTVSDGMLTPEELVCRASDTGVTCMALTDHDNLDGLEEAAAAAGKTGMTLIPGIELSCGGEKEIHVLGYGFNPDDVELNEFCREKQEERYSRAKRMTDQLVDRGISIRYERVLALANGVPGRPHVAQAIVEAGFASSLQDAFRRFLNPGCCGYVAKKDVPVAHGAALIRHAGGCPVLAHPMQLGKSHAVLDSLIREWTEHGLMGIEVYHPSADAGDIPALIRITERCGLLITGGSDYHGRTVKPDIEIGQGLNRWRSMRQDVMKLLDACSFKWNAGRER